MKKTILAAAIVGLIVCLIAFVPLKKKVTIDDFSWSVDGKKAPYAFHIVNRTNDPLIARVYLEAQSVRESRAGTKLGMLGTATVEIMLAPREEKKVSGAIDLITAGNSGTVVSFYAEIKPPNQALQHNAYARHASCFAPVAPIIVVADL